MIETTKKKLKDKAGFTLIELVVVIAVIGILASIAIPRVTGITANAKKQASKQHLMILNSAVERYKAVTGDDNLSELGVKSADSKADAASHAVSGLISKKYIQDDVSTTKLPDGGTLTMDKSDYYFETPSSLND